MTTTLRRVRRWLQPGLGVKRWLLALFIGLGLVGLGTLLCFNLFLAELIASFGSAERAVRVGIIFLAVGVLVAAGSFVAVMRHLARVLLPDGHPLVDRMWQLRRRAGGIKVVALGGGTGLSTLLRGLKRYTTNLTAVVVVSDDGGSSGRLQRELPNLPLPPGDIRNCLVALADEEPLMTRLLQYRFAEQAPELGGHSLGNLLIAALVDIKGDFQEAIRETSRVLAIRGQVLPCTLDSVRLWARLQDGRLLCGESQVGQAPAPIDYVYLEPPNPKPLDEVLEAIAEAELIVIGPGSLYTSVIPNLLVPGIAQALVEAKAVRVYVCNVMTQPGETSGMRAVDHIVALHRHGAKECFEYVVMNDQRPHPDVLERYRATGAEFIAADVRGVAQLGYLPVTAHLLHQDTYARHDPERLARVLIELVESGR